MDETRPILFLDVDGVLNGATSTFQEHLIEVAGADMPRSPFTKSASADVMNFRIRFDNRLESLLAELGEYYELVWATTWEHLANTYFSPLLGLGQLGVVELSTEPATDAELFYSLVAEWKWRSLVRYANGRAFAFVDDNARKFAEAYAPGRGLWPVVVVPEYILSQSEVDILVNEAKGISLDALDHEVFA